MGHSSRFIDASAPARVSSVLLGSGSSAARFLVAGPPWILSVAQLGECRAFMRGNMIGLAPLDLILRRVGTRVMIVALIVEVTRVDPNDRAADAPSLRVPSDSISNVLPFSHWVFLVVQASSELRCGLRIT